MSYARNTLKLPFEEVAQKLRGLRRSEVVVRFRYRNSADKEVKVKSLKMSSLYKDWYNDCTICPGSGARISHLHILLNPTCTALDITDEVTFEMLMDTIEDVMIGHKF